MARTDPINFFHKILRFVWFILGMGFYRCIKKKNFHFRKPQHFLLGWTTYQFFSYVKKNSTSFGRKSSGIWLFTGRFLSFRFLKQDRGARTIRTQTTTVLVEMLDDWGGFFFLVFAVDFVGDNLEKCQRLSGVFTKQKTRLRKLHKCPEQKSFSLQLKKKNTPSTICGFFLSKNKKCMQKSSLPLFPSTKKNSGISIPATSQKKQISGSWDKLDTPLPCMAWIWFNSSGLTQASWAPSRGSEFCLGWPEIHWNPRNQLSFWQFFLIFREFLMRIKRWFVLKKQKLLWKRKKSAKRCDTQINEMRQE